MSEREASGRDREEQRRREKARNRGQGRAQPEQQSWLACGRGPAAGWRQEKNQPGLQRASRQSRHRVREETGKEEHGESDKRDGSGKQGAGARVRSRAEGDGAQWGYGATRGEAKRGGLRAVGMGGRQ